MENKCNVLSESFNVKFYPTCRIHINYKVCYNCQYNCRMTGKYTLEINVHFDPVSTVSFKYSILTKSRYITTSRSLYGEV